MPFKAIIKMFIICDAESWILHRLACNNGIGLKLCQLCMKQCHGETDSLCNQIPASAGQLKIMMRYYGGDI